MTVFRKRELLEIRVDLLVGFFQQSRRKEIMSCNHLDDCERCRTELETAEDDRDKVIKVLTDIMPFVLEDYWPNCATPAYKLAVEAAKAVLKPNNMLTVSGGPGEKP